MYLICIKRKIGQLVSVSYLGDNLADISGSPFTKLNEARHKAADWWEAEKIITEYSARTHNVRHNYGHIYWYEKGKDCEWHVSVIDITTSITIEI